MQSLEEKAKELEEIAKTARIDYNYSDTKRGWELNEVIRKETEAREAREEAEKAKV